MPPVKPCLINRKYRNIAVMCGRFTQAYTGCELYELYRLRDRSATNIPSECGNANIAIDDAMILPYDANLALMEFSERAPCTLRRRTIHVLGYKPALRLKWRCACRKSNPDILVVQSTQDRTAKNVSSPLNGARCRPCSTIDAYVPHC
jgi:hypothetical protein